MSLPWSAQQREWLREMGFDVLARRDTGPGETAALEATHADGAGAGRAMRDAAAPQGRHGAGSTRAADAGVAPSSAGGAGIPAALSRIAGGVDLAPLLAAHPPRDPPSRRALWRALRPLRKAARGR